jgi:TPR repeat protein
MVMKISRLLTLSLLLVFNNAIAQISKEDVQQVFFDANAGNHKAQNYLGSMYATGNSVKTDNKLAAA